MSRIRTIKPEFWASAQVVECSPNARLMFIGMWNFCDDLGRHAFSPKQIKMEIFPGDNFTTDEILRMLGELSANGLITVYTVDGKELLQVTGWSHQKIDHPQKPKFPGPLCDDSENVQRKLAPESTRRDLTTLRVVSRARATTTQHKKSKIQARAEITPSQIAAARKKGLFEEEWRIQWAKFRTFNRAKGSEFADWDAAWIMWLEKLEKPPPEKPNGHIVVSQVFVVEDTPQWNAWENFYRKSKGSTPPKTDHGVDGRGWYFPTEWPPATDA
jgi:hypothetical protein